MSLLQGLPLIITVSKKRKTKRKEKPNKYYYLLISQITKQKIYILYKESKSRYFEY